jgi:branched-chain amino acid transport system substrate-binding protein
MTSETMMGAWPLVEESAIVFLSPTVSTSQLSGLDDHFFRLNPSNSYQAHQLANYVTEELGVESVVVFYDTDNLAYTQTYRDNFADQFQLSGGKILADNIFSSSAEPDFTEILTQPETQNADAIMIIASAVDTALIAQQARLNGLEQPILVSLWGLTDDLIQNGGQAVEGILAVSANNENNLSEGYLVFESRFREQYGRRPTFGAIFGYETALVLASALEKTGGQVDGLPQALLETDEFVGINGTIGLDEYGDVIRPVYLITVQDGKFVTLSELGFSENK